MNYDKTIKFKLQIPLPRNRWIAWTIGELTIINSLEKKNTFDTFLCQIDYFLDNDKTILLDDSWLSFTSRKMFINLVKLNLLAKMKTIPSQTITKRNSRKNEENPVPWL